MLASLAGLGDDSTVAFSDMTAAQQAAFEAQTGVTGDGFLQWFATADPPTALTPSGTPAGTVTSSSWLVMGAVFLGLVLIGGGSGRRR